MALQRVHEFSDAVSTLVVRAGGYAMLAAAILVSVDVVLRKAFNITFRGAAELSTYAYAISASWAYSYTLFRRSHIRVDVIYRLLPAPLQAALDVLALLTLGACVALMTYHSTLEVIETVRLGSTANTPLRTPLWIPETLWVTGLIFFLYAIMLLVIRAGEALARGDVNRVRRLAGLPGMEESPGDEVL